MKKFLIPIIIYVMWLTIVAVFFDTSEPTLELSNTEQSKIEDVIVPASDTAEDEIPTYEVSADYDKETGGPDRMEELGTRFPGYRVVDGENDSDMTYAEVCSAIEAHEDVIVIYHGTEYAVSNGLKFRAMSDFQYFWVDDWSCSVVSDE